MKNILINFIYFYLLLSFINAQNISNPFDFLTDTNRSSIERAGDILQIALPITALSSTYVLKDKDSRIEFWKSYLSSISLTYLLKYTINKKRPNGDCCESFPSGHTTAAFSGAMFFQKKYGFKYGIPSLLLASFVGYSRVYAQKHYWEDVIVGGTIGIISNIIFTKSNHRVDLSLRKNQDSINFLFNINI